MTKPAVNSDLLDVLLQHGDLNQNNVRMLRAFIQEWSVSPFEAIVESRTLSEGRLADLISNHFGVERLHNIEAAHLDREVVRQAPYLEARKHTYIAMKADTDNERIAVALADPTNAAIVSNIQTHLGPNVNYFVCTRSEVHFALNYAYTPAEQFGERQI